MEWGDFSGRNEDVEAVPDVTFFFSLLQRACGLWLGK